jgi:hypothetical protein
MNNFPYYHETIHGSTGNLNGLNISWLYGKRFPYYHETVHGSKMLLGQCKKGQLYIVWSQGFLFERPKSSLSEREEVFVKYYLIFPSLGFPFQTVEDYTGFPFWEGDCSYGKDYAGSPFLRSSDRTRKIENSLRTQHFKQTNALYPTVPKTYLKISWNYPFISIIFSVNNLMS